MTALGKQSSFISQKVHLIHKLLLLENARNTVEEELGNLTKKAYQEVQDFLNASCPNTEFIDLSKGLDMKCQVMQSLTVLLKDFTVEPKVDFLPTVKKDVSTNQLQPLGVKKILMTDVVKFEPRLKRSFMADTITKVVQVLGAAPSLQQLKLFFTSEPAAVQQHDMTGSISSNLNSAVLTTVSRCSSKTEEEQVECDENSQPDSETAPPVITQRREISVERPRLLPPIQVIVPEISNPKPVTILPPMSSGPKGDVQVQHQKQTSTQLLHYLKRNAGNMDAPQVFVMEQMSSYSSDYPQPTSPAIIMQSCHIREFVADDRVDTLQKRSADFRLKRVESSGCVTYQCALTTENELWDIGDILIEEPCPEPVTPVDDDYDNVTAQVETPQAENPGKIQSFECTVAKQKKLLAEAKMQTFNSVNIPQFLIRRFEEIEVVVSHIVDPGDFYIQHADSPEKLQSLIMDSWKASSSCAEQNCIPGLGTLVMGWFPEQKQWCRAQVTKICGVSREDQTTKRGTGIQVEVKRLDHGDNVPLSLRNIKELTPEMASLPLQALQVSLANVTPVNGSQWSEESVTWFKAITLNRTFYARFYTQRPKVSVELFLEKGNLAVMRRSASLSLRLAQNGHALHDKVKKAAVIRRNTVQPHSCK